MADDTKKDQPTETSLDSFKGTKSEVLKQKSDFISKWGFAAYEKLVLNSSTSVKK
jgi:hypothetical protein